MTKPNTIELRTDLLTQREAAKKLGVTHSAVRLAIWQKRLPCIRVYNSVLITPEDLEAYLNHTQPEGKKPLGRPKKGYTKV